MQLRRDHVADRITEERQLPNGLIDVGGRGHPFFPFFVLGAGASPVRLNLGSGNRRLKAGFVTLDSDPEMRADITARVPPIPLGDESCREVFCSHLIEHLGSNDALALVSEIWRVLVPGGRAEIHAPYALSHGAWQDPDHKSYWVVERFLYHTPHFAYLNRPYERRFQMAAGAVTGDGTEVRVVLIKRLDRTEACTCPLCRGGV